MPFKADRLRVLGAKIEATAGTAIAIADADASVPVFNTTYADNTSYTRRENVTGGKLKGRRGPRIGTMGFDVEAMGLAASGAVPVWATRFLPPCGFVNSGGTYTYTRTVANQKTITLQSMIDGQFRRIYGAAGKVALNYNAGGISYFRFEFTGIVDDVGETTQLAPTLITTPPILGAASFTYNSVTLTGPSGVIDWGQTVQPIEGPTASGFTRFCVSDYNPIMTVEPYGEAHSVVDFDGDWDANEERAIELILGTDVNNEITIAASLAAHSAAPNWGERGRLVTRGLNLDFNDDAAPTITFA